MVEKESDWMEELLTMKYTMVGKPVITIFNDDGIAISDGVENF